MTISVMTLKRALERADKAASRTTLDACALEVLGANVRSLQDQVERLRAENAAMRAVVEALRTSVEQRAAQLEARGKGGQHVGDFGEFVSMPPSAVHRMRWYLREFDRTKPGAGE